MLFPIYFSFFLPQTECIYIKWPTHEFGIPIAEMVFYITIIIIVKMMREAETLLLLWFFATFAKLIFRLINDIETHFQRKRNETKRNKATLTHTLSQNKEPNHIIIIIKVLHKRLK